MVAEAPPFPSTSAPQDIMMRDLYKRIHVVEQFVGVTRYIRTGTVAPPVAFAVERCIPVYMITAEVSQKQGWNHPTDVANGRYPYDPPADFTVTGARVVVHSIKCRLIEACVVVSREPYFFVSTICKSTGAINSGYFSNPSRTGNDIPMTFRVGDIFTFPGLPPTSLPAGATTLHNQDTLEFAAGFRPTAEMGTLTIPDDAPGRIQVTIVFSRDDPPPVTTVPIVELGKTLIYEAKDIAL